MTITVLSLTFVEFLFIYFFNGMHFSASNSQSNFKINNSIRNIQNINNKTNTIHASNTQIDNISEKMPKTYSKCRYTRTLNSNYIWQSNKSRVTCPLLSKYETKFENMKIHPYRTCSHFGSNIPNKLASPMHYHFPTYPTKYIPLKQSESVCCYFASKDLINSPEHNDAANTNIHLHSNIADQSSQIYFSAHNTLPTKMSPIKEDLLKMFEDQLQKLKNAPSTTFFNKISDLNYTQVSPAASCLNLDKDEFTKLWSYIPYIQFDETNDKSYAVIVDNAVKLLEQDKQEEFYTDHAEAVQSNYFNKKESDFQIYLDELASVQQLNFSKIEKNCLNHDESSSFPGIETETITSNYNKISSSTPSCEVKLREEKTAVQNFNDLEISNIIHDNESNKNACFVATGNPRSSKIPVLNKSLSRSRPSPAATLNKDINSKIPVKKQAKKMVIHQTHHRQLITKKSVRNFIDENIRMSNIKKFHRKSSERVTSFKESESSSVMWLTFSPNKSVNTSRGNSNRNVQRLEVTPKVSKDIDNYERENSLINVQINRHLNVVKQLNFKQMQTNLDEIFEMHKTIEQDRFKNRQMIAYDTSRDIENIRNLIADSGEDSMQ
jgi:hypothetical protein